jgi:hypothetical protein
MRALAAVALTVLPFFFWLFVFVWWTQICGLTALMEKEPDSGRKGQSWCPVRPVRSFAGSTFWLSLTP